MIFKFLKIMGIGFILSVSTLANATLIDYGDYTTDTESGLDWLDWTETNDMTQSGALALFSGEGWRIATANEAVELLENHFDVVIGGSNDVLKQYIDDFTDLKLEFLQLFGALQGGGSSTAAIVGFGLIGVDDYRVKGGIYQIHSEVYGGINYSSVNTGVPLVRVTDVSEPSIIALFALGLVGIGFARRRQF
jgi:hypothetical protein